LLKHKKVNPRINPGPLLAVPNVTAHPLTASIPITVLLYKGPLLCSFNASVKGLSEIMGKCRCITSFINFVTRSFSTEYANIQFEYSTTLRHMLAFIPSVKYRPINDVVKAKAPSQPSRPRP